MAIIEINLVAVTARLTDSDEHEIELVPEKAITVTEQDLIFERMHIIWMMPLTKHPSVGWMIGGVNIYIHGERWTKSTFEKPMHVEPGGFLEVTLVLQDNLAANLRHKLGRPAVHGLTWTSR